MTSPLNAVTLEDERYYEWHAYPGVHFPSITTIIKQGVPKSMISKWAVKKTADLALDQLDLLMELREREHGDE